MTNDLMRGRVDRIRTTVLVAAFTLAGFAIPASVGMIFGLPLPHAQDELSYVLAGDTYANGRITNPTPVLWEHFETPHVLVEPSYISKYPPLQGLFLAFGQRFFGYQIVGVWLSCGFFAASLFWMLSVWFDRRWAIVATAAMVLLLGVNSYWAQSFWGGMIASAGGAVFLGAYRRMLDGFTTADTVALVAGGVILVNSRPFEGTMMMVPFLLHIGWRFFANRRSTVPERLVRVALPAAMLGALALSAMLYQYYRVTGSPFVLPYSVHHSQYYPTPLFSFQPLNPDARRGNPRIRRIFEQYTYPPILQTMLDAGLPDLTILRSVYGFVYLIVSLPLFLFSPLLALLFFAGLPVILRNDGKLAFVGISAATTCACIAVGVWWDQHHYAAPLTASCVLLLTAVLRTFHASADSAAKRRIATGAITLAVLLSGVYSNAFGYRQSGMLDDYSADFERLAEAIAMNEPVTIRVPTRATFFKPELEAIAEGRPGRFLAIVSYEEGFDYHDEIVYNRADIPNAKLIWAHDLGADKNARLTEAYPGRTVLYLRLAGNRIEIAPQR